MASSTKGCVSRHPFAGHVLYVLHHFAIQFRKIDPLNLTTDDNSKKTRKYVLKKSNSFACFSMPQPQSVGLARLTVFTAMFECFLVIWFAPTNPKHPQNPIGNKIEAP